MEPNRHSIWLFDISNHQLTSSSVNNDEMHQNKATMHYSHACTAFFQGISNNGMLQKRSASLHAPMHSGSGKRQDTQPSLFVSL